MNYKLAKMKPIQLSIWDGIVIGGGVGISCHAPIRIATENTLFSMPESKIGAFSGLGCSYFLQRIQNNISLGIYLGVTGV